jgi:hypothetical protein
MITRHIYCSSVFSVTVSLLAVHLQLPLYATDISEVYLLEHVTVSLVTHTSLNTYLYCIVQRNSAQKNNVCHPKNKIQKGISKFRFYKSHNKNNKSTCLSKCICSICHHEWASEKHLDTFRQGWLRLTGYQSIKCWFRLLVQTERTTIKYHS